VRCNLANSDGLHQMRGVSFDHFLTFASEAETVGLWGIGLLLLAIVAGYLERRGLKRNSIDQVGWMPWFAISFVCLIIGAGLVALAIKGMATG
jgi:hypothetical protein